MGCIYLKKFIQNLENNISCSFSGMKWDENTKIWNNIIFGTLLSLPLCDDSRQQFIQELKGVLYVERSIYIKRKGIHPLIIAKKFMSDL